MSKDFPYPRNGRAKHRFENHHTTRSSGIDYLPARKPLRGSLQDPRDRMPVNPEPVSSLTYISAKNLDGPSDIKVLYLLHSLKVRSFDREQICRGCIDPIEPLANVVFDDGQTDWLVKEPVGSLQERIGAHVKVLPGANEDGSEPIELPAVSQNLTSAIIQFGSIEPPVQKDQVNFLLVQNGNSLLSSRRGNAADVFHGEAHGEELTHFRVIFDDEDEPVLFKRIHNP